MSEGDGLQRNATLLTQQQLAALDMLVSGNSVTETARALEMDRTTVSRCKNRNATFRSGLRQRRAELSRVVQSRLEALALKAAQTFDTLLDDPNSRVRLGAANTRTRPRVVGRRPSPTQGSSTPLC